MMSILSFMSSYICLIAILSTSFKIPHLAHLRVYVFPTAAYTWVNPTTKQQRAAKDLVSGHSIFFINTHNGIIDLSRREKEEK